MSQPNDQKNNLKYVFMAWSGIPFRFRIWLAGKLIPKRLSQLGRAWLAGIDVELKEKSALNLQRVPKPNREQRRRSAKQ